MLKTKGVCEAEDAPCLRVCVYMYEPMEQELFMYVTVRVLSNCYWLTLRQVAQCLSLY